MYCVRGKKKRKRSGVKFSSFFSVSRCSLSTSSSSLRFIFVLYTPHESPANHRWVSNRLIVSNVFRTFTGEKRNKAGGTRKAWRCREHGDNAAMSGINELRKWLFSSRKPSSGLKRITFMWKQSASPSKFSCGALILADGESATDFI